MNKPPLIAHVIYRLDIGGLENGLVNLINRIPEDRYRHVILCLKDHTDFRHRIRRRDVEVIDLNKREGHDFRMMWRLWRLFRKLRPQIVHTRNLAALDAVVPAALAGVPLRIHGEHGRDMQDLDGNNVRQRQLRRALFPWVHRIIALSRDLESYLRDKVGVKPGRIVQIYNGVDAHRFHPSPPKTGEVIVFGSVGRMQAVKDPLTLVRAFIRLLDMAPSLRTRARLLMVGDGPLLQEATSLLDKAGCADLAELTGAREDVPHLMREMDVFLLPSLAEGISNTILEAMATGLPVIATRVGGNGELVEQEVTGLLVPPADPEAMALAMLRYATEPTLRRVHGHASRSTVENRFSMDAMVNAYLLIYDLNARQGIMAGDAPPLS